MTDIYKEPEVSDFSFLYSRSEFPRFIPNLMCCHKQSSPLTLCYRLQAYERSDDSKLF